MCDHNECPTCKQDWVADTDYECTACGRPASEHISVTSVCRIMYETRAREAALIVKRDKLLDKLAAERALADRLAIHLEDTLSGWITDKCFRPAPYEAALAAWKEARSE